MPEAREITRPIYNEQAARILRPVLTPRSSCPLCFGVSRQLGAHRILYKMMYRYREQESKNARLVTQTALCAARATAVENNSMERTLEAIRG